MDNRYFIFSACFILYLLKAIDCQNITCPANRYGANCDFILCDKNDFQYDQCKNSGQCIKNIKETNQFKCLCNPTHSGALCEKPLCLDYCYNDGKCKLNANKTECLCNIERYSGDRCQFDKCSKLLDKCPVNCYMNSKCNCFCGDECDTNYCNNKNGTCYEDGNGKLACKCRTGYSNPVCMINDCSGFCFNGGTCMRASSSIYCECSKGYEGRRCDQIILGVSYANRSSKAIFYGITVTILSCLIAIGVYFSIQRGYFQNTLTARYRSQFNNHNNNIDDTNNPVHSNIHFNKLVEDDIKKSEVNA